MKYWLFILGLGATLPAFSKTPPPLKLYPPDSVIQGVPIKKHEGLVLLELDVDGTASSIEFSRVRVKDQSYLKPNQNLQTAPMTYTLNFMDKPAGFYFFKLPKGLYQVKRIKVPYFNLPFKLDTNNRRTWRFSVDSDQVNFIGRLEIEKERVERSVRVDLINRIATKQSEIEQLIAPILKEFPLRNGVGVRDDFFSDLNKKVEASHETKLQ